MCQYCSTIIAGSVSVEKMFVFKQGMRGSLLRVPVFLLFIRGSVPPVRSLNPRMQGPTILMSNYICDPIKYIYQYYNFCFCPIIIKLWAFEHLN